MNRKARFESSLQRKYQGFTLMELMIALSIMGIIVTLIWGSFSKTFDTSEFVQSVQQKYHNVRVAMTRIADEISMAFLYFSKDPNIRAKTLFVGEDGNPGDRLTFTSFSHMRMVRDCNESDQNVLTYYLERSEDKPGTYNLMRMEKNRIYDEETNIGEEKGVSLILAEDVTSFQLEYLDEQQDMWVEEWDSRSVEKADRLPRMVKVSITIIDEKGEEVTFVTKSTIHLRKILNF
jgi:general secretion pathway protein J